MDIVGNVKDAGSTVINLGKRTLLPMFVGLIVIGIICGFVPAFKKFLM